ncbi:MAG: type IV pilin protein [Gammaproteobacteria bacterium]|jgi:type IV pilus assembly protein PilE|uniref:Type IV pilus biogenesis protein PilE n=1 Tax=Shewanella baltica (strain OS195) TaxID=399599 RepID=A9L4V5_SHEB9|nr:type IV pilin protein [Shewanella baltica]MBU1391760.1 type IV pilin protein [Gammaproteobacteria bacterium]QYX65812.1 type IV pilin protein [Shewanella putrefaciens]ABX48340.1 type IV pilus biogenesis protein PilE [Shewanella baltica OS195]ADT93370.1 type IV pilus biogenesis protein PilE [Shewanella baltica OS678]EHC06591.1 type IV pilus biogenesis protein PilE [Shewanella baltica OS625]
MKVQCKGFTLIEVMITVVIIGILAAIAYPSYTQYIALSARSEGLAALMRIANLQEQYYLDNRVYATDLTKLVGANPYVTEHQHYSVSSSGTSSFTIKAVAQGVQASRDASCSPLTISDTGAKGPSAECWK